MNRMYDIDEMMKDARLDLDVNDAFYLKNLKARRLFLEVEIDGDSVGEIKAAILYFNADDKGTPVEERKPIWLYICSPGGSVQDGFGLVDVIEASKTPVYTVNIGYCHSMALPIFLAGHKRYALKHAQFLMHDGTVYCVDSVKKTQDYIEFEKVYRERVTKKVILNHSKLTEEFYNKKEREEWYFLTDEAKERGMVDIIVDNLEDIVGGDL